MKENPDFYIIPTECGGISELRSCWFLDRLSDDEGRNDYMLVKINPPLIGQQYGLGNKDIDCLILATRHKGFSLFPMEKWPSITDWPLHVYVFRIIDEKVMKIRCITDEKQLALSEWGTVYRSKEQASEIHWKFRNSESDHS